jgi:hypothetical protein
MFRFSSLVTLIILAVLVSLSFAAIPKLINYQGMLTDVGGTPLNGSYNLIFRIYDDTTGAGTLQWTETQNGVPVDHGLFNVVLGKSTALNLAFDKSYWLEVQVGAEVMPRIRFTSVAYAYRAHAADTAYATAPGAGSHWSVSDSVLYTNEEWGMARGGAGNVLYGDKTHTLVNFGVACTTGTSGQNDQNSTVSGGLGNHAAGSFSTVGGGYWNSTKGYSATVSGGYANSADTTCATVSGGFDNVTLGPYSAVGGGTHNRASGAFSVVSGGGGWLTLVDSNAAIGDYSVVPGGRGNVALGDYSFAGGRRAMALHVGSFVWADSTDADFTSTGSNQFLIRASGGVGIGVSSPDEVLDVNGRIGLRPGIYASAGIWLKTQAGVDEWYMGKTNLGDFNQVGFYKGAWRMVVDDDGNVGIGTTEPERRLHIVGDNPRILIEATSISPEINFKNSGDPLSTVWALYKDGGTDDFKFYQNGDKVTIQNSTGNVGIGIADPGSYKLYVNGDAAKPNGGSWSTPSDRRLKETEGVYGYGLSEVSQLSPVRYRYQEGNALSLPTDKEFVGLIAQDVEKVIPEAVDKNDQGYLLLNNDPIIWAMLNAIKELKAENEQLKKRIDALEGR